MAGKTADGVRNLITVILRKDMADNMQACTEKLQYCRNSHTQPAVQSMFLFLRTLKLPGGKRQDVRSGDTRNLPTPERVSVLTLTYFSLVPSLFFLTATSLSFLMHKNLYCVG